MAAPEGNDYNLIWTEEKAKVFLEFMLFKIDFYNLEYFNELDSFFGFKSGMCRYILNKYELISEVNNKLNNIPKTRKSFIERKKPTKNDAIKQNKYIKEKYKNNPSYRIRHSFSSLLRHHLKKQKGERHTFDILGYSLDDLKNHLQSKFNNKMSWDNYGSYWHVDHIKPASLFNHSNHDDFIECWSLSNLQPLEAYKNIIKSNSYECK